MSSLHVKIRLPFVLVLFPVSLLITLHKNYKIFDSFHSFVPFICGHTRQRSHGTHTLSHTHTFSKALSSPHPRIPHSHTRTAHLFLGSPVHLDFVNSIGHFQYFSIMSLSLLSDHAHSALFVKSKGNRPSSPRASAHLPFSYTLFYSFLFLRSVHPPLCHTEEKSTLLSVPGSQVGPTL